MGLKDVVSMDDFKDLVELTQEFGELKLGQEIEDEDLKIMAFYSPFKPRPVNKLWF